ncbi:MAG: SLC13 family permease [Deltaproteobacteria bacterium]|nr:SLC13 family permease [Deltaproteobacteria bacterium]
MTLQIALVLLIFCLTIVLFISKLLRVDIIAILVMVALPWLGLVEPAEAFSGLASNAVIAIISVMILGYGVDRSGAMNRLIQPIISAAGSNERRLIVFVSVTVGLISAFMPNIGAAALLLPAMLRMAKSTNTPASRLLMPMGFAAILGGNLSMVGSSPLLILNDLLRQGGQKTFALFSVTPVGIALLGAGILYFLLFGKSVLPGAKKKEKKPVSMQQRLIETWHLPTTVFHCVIPARSPLVGKTRTEVKMRTKYKLNLLAIAEGNDVLYAPWRHTPFVAHQQLAVLGDKKDFERFVSDFKLKYSKNKKPFKRLEIVAHAGFAELIIPVKSPIAGKTLRSIELRKIFGVEPIMLLSGDREERGAFSDQELQPGNTIIVHGRWELIKAMADNIRFVLVTPVEAAEAAGESRPITATLCFAGGIVLALSGVPLSLGLLTGALAMILLKIVSIDEAYRAINWKTVFLLAGLIPLGIAMDHTGAARYIASHLMLFLEGTHTIIILFAVGILATLFSLFMSNVTTTVLLVPLVMIIGDVVGISPRALALLVALCASNAFALPIHQVNALLMSPGGYDNADFMKAGGIMTIIYITISVLMIYLLFI